MSSGLWARSKLAIAGGHQARGVALDDLRVGVGDRAFEVGVIGGDCLPVAERGGAAGEAFEARAGAGGAGEGVAARAAVACVERLAAGDERRRRRDRPESGGHRRRRGRSGRWLWSERLRSSLLACRVVLAAVIADRVGGDQEAEDDAARGEAAEQPAPEPIGCRVACRLWADSSGFLFHFMAAANMSGMPTERANMSRPVTRPRRVAPRPVTKPKAAIARW